MAPGGVEPPRADSKSAALSTELRGRAASVGTGPVREGGGRDSNPRPPGPQPGALPTELPPPRDGQYIRCGISARRWRVLSVRPSGGTGGGAAHALRLVARGGRAGRAHAAARGRRDGGRRDRRRRLPRPLDGVAAEGSSSPGSTSSCSRPASCGHGPSGRNGGFVSTLWDDLPILRDRVGDAPRGRGVPRLRARGARDRRVVRRATASTRGTGAARHDPGRDERRRSSATGTSVVDACAGGRRARRGRRRSTRDEVAARCASPAFLGGAAPPDRGERAAGAPRARAARAGDRGAASALHEQHAGAAASARDGSRGDRASGTVRARAAVLAVNSATAGFHGYRLALAVASSHMVITRARPRRDRGDRLDGRRERSHDCRTLLHYFRTTKDGRIALGWGGGRMGFGGAAPRAARYRPRRRGATRPRRSRASSRSSRAARSRTPGAARSTSPPRTCRSSAARGRVHHGFGFTGNGVGPDLPRRRDPRPARARPARRAHAARDRRARPQAVPARAAALPRRQLIRAALVRSDRRRRRAARPTPSRGASPRCRGGSGSTCRAERVQQARRASMSGSTCSGPRRVRPLSCQEDGRRAPRTGPASARPAWVGAISRISAT